MSSSDLLNYTKHVPVKERSYRINNINKINKRELLLVKIKNLKFSKKTLYNIDQNELEEYFYFINTLYEKKDFEEKTLETIISRFFVINEKNFKTPFLEKSITSSLNTCYYEDFHINFKDGLKLVYWNPTRNANPLIFGKNNLNKYKMLSCYIIKINYLILLINLCKNELLFCCPRQTKEENEKNEENQTEKKKKNPSKSNDWIWAKTFKNFNTLFDYKNIESLINKNFSSEEVSDNTSDISGSKFYDIDYLKKNWTKIQQDLIEKKKRKEFNDSVQENEKILKNYKINDEINDFNLSINYESIENNIRINNLENFEILSLYKKLLKILKDNVTTMLFFEKLLKYDVVEKKYDFMELFDKKLFDTMNIVIPKIKEETFSPFIYPSTNSSSASPFITNNIDLDPYSIKKRIKRPRIIGNTKEIEYVFNEYEKKYIYSILTFNDLFLKIVPKKLNYFLDQSDEKYIDDVFSYEQKKSNNYKLKLELKKNSLINDVIKSNCDLDYIYVKFLRFMKLNNSTKFFYTNNLNDTMKKDKIKEYKIKFKNNLRRYLNYYFEEFIPEKNDGFDIKEIFNIFFLKFDDLIKFFRSNINDPNFVNRYFNTIKYFFPFTKLKDFENCKLLKNLIIGDEKRKYETKKSIYLKHMELLTNNTKYTIGFTDEDLKKNVSTHIIFHSIILYINCALEIFKLIRKVKKFKGRLFIKFLFYNFRLNSKNFFEKSNENEYSFSNLNYYINYNFFDPYEINGKTENDFFQSEYDVIQKIQFHTYLILYNYVPLFTYMLKKEIFTDELIKNDKIYKFFKPMDNSNFYSGDLPNLNLVLEKIDLLLRKKPCDENYFFFFFTKIAPTLCQIRDFENIIKTIYDKSKKMRKLLNKAIQCSMLGLYEFSNHDVLAKDFGSLINWYYTFYQKDIVMNTSEKRSLIFQTFQENKVAIRTLSRTLYVFYIDNHKIFKDAYVKMCWDGIHYITYEVFRNSNIINNNTLNEYFFLYQTTLKKYEEQIKIPKNSTISEKEKTHLEDLLNNDTQFWNFLKKNKKNLDKKRIFKEISRKKQKREITENFRNFFKIDLNNNHIPERKITKEEEEKEFMEEFIERTTMKKMNYAINSGLQLSNLLAKLTGAITIKDTLCSLTDEQSYIIKNYIYKKFFQKYENGFKVTEKKQKPEKLYKSFFDLKVKDENFLSIFDERLTNEKETENDFLNVELNEASKSYNNDDKFFTEIIHKIDNIYEIILPCKKNDSKEKKVDHGWSATPNSRINTKPFVETLLEKIFIMYILHFRIRTEINSYTGMIDFSYVTPEIEKKINNFKNLGGLSHDYNLNIKIFLKFLFKELNFSKKSILSLKNFFTFYITRKRPGILLNSLQYLKDKEIMILLYFIKRDSNINSLQLIKLSIYHQIKVFFKKGIDSHNFINFMIIKPENYIFPDTMKKVFELCFFYCCERVANLGKKSIKKNNHGLPSKKLTFLYNLLQRREEEKNLTIVDDTILFSVDIKKILKMDLFYTCYLQKNKKKKKKVIKMFQNLNTNLIKYSKKNRNFKNLISEDILHNFNLKEIENSKIDEFDVDEEKKNKNKPKTAKEKKKEKEEKENEEISKFLKENFLKNKDAKQPYFEDDKLPIFFNLNENNAAPMYEKMCFKNEQNILIEKNDNTFDGVNSIHGKKFRKKKNLNIMNYLYKEINNFDIHHFYGKDPLDYFKPIDRLAKLILKSLLKSKNCYDNKLNRMELMKGIKYGVITHKKNVSKIVHYCENCGCFEKSNNQLYIGSSYYCQNCADKNIFFISTNTNFNDLIKDKYDQKNLIFNKLYEYYKKKNLDLNPILKNKILLAITQTKIYKNEKFVFDKCLSILKNLKEIYEQITKIRLKFNDIINPQENLTKDFNSKILLKKDMEFHLYSENFKSHWSNFLQKKLQTILFYDENTQRIKLFYLDKKKEKKDKNSQFLNILDVTELKQFN